MKLPPKTVIDNFTPFCVCIFKDLSLNAVSPAHFYINVPITDNTSKLLVMITSKGQTIIDNYKIVNRSAIESMIPVDGARISCLDRPSFINCNEPFLYSTERLIDVVDPALGIDIVLRDIPDDLKFDVIEAITISNRVERKTKNILVNIG